MAAARRRSSTSTQATKGAEGEVKGPSLDKALNLIAETLEGIVEERGEGEPIWGSMIKQAIRRRNPGFSERAYGCRSFNEMLLEAQKRGMLELQHDEKSGGYKVRRLDSNVPF